MMNAAAFARIYEGLGNPWVCAGTKILQYADDALVFIRAEKSYCAILKTILLCFELISGLAINFHKSSVSVIGRCSQFLSQLLSCFLGKLSTCLTSSEVSGTASKWEKTYEI